MGKLKHIFLLSAGVFSFNALGATTASDGVVSLAAYGLGNIAIGMVSTAVINPASCALTASQKIYKIIDTSDHGKNMFAIALAAKTAGSKITLWIDDTRCDSNGYAVVNSIVAN